MFHEAQTVQVSRRNLRAFDQVGITPRRSILGVLLEKPEDGRTIHVRRNRQSSNLHESRGDVHVADDAVHNTTVSNTRTTNEERNADVEFKWKGFAYFYKFKN